MSAMTESEMIARIDAVLPQTQCTRCGFAGCRPYAEALAAGTTELNRCPPGGDEVVRMLAVLTGRPILPLDPACGARGPLAVAVIDEATCIGCTLCIDACPVDAIIGAAKRMHAVMPSLCTGCELCLAPCPVDCIVMAPTARAWDRAAASAARARHDTRATRLARRERVSARTAVVASNGMTLEQRQALAAAAVARARARRAGA
jgi:Na+-translocating ferredoxin:NAD+ oxidoreductase subunit B